MKATIVMVVTMLWMAIIGVVGGRPTMMAIMWQIEAQSAAGTPVFFELRLWKSSQNPAPEQAFEKTRRIGLAKLMVVLTDWPWDGLQTDRNHMRSVVICASKRYADEIKLFAAELRDLGVLTFEPNFSEPIPEASEFSSDHVRNMIFKGITFEHFEWIRRADVCYVLNIDEYCGVSVTLEMGYAFALGKIIVARSMSTGDPCRDALIDFVASTPKELHGFLNGTPPRQIFR